MNGYMVPGKQAQKEENVKERVNQLFKDKLILVMLVLGLLTIVAAAGVMTLRRGRTEERPYLNMEGSPEHFVDGEETQQTAGGSDAAKESGEVPKESEALAKGGEAEDGQAKDDKVKDDRTDERAGRETRRETAAQEADRESQALARETVADEAEPAGAGLDAASALALNFAETQSMLWPVEGNVLLDYSMDSTVYFPTLEQYKCNPGVVIQGEVSQPVAAPANARVLEAGVNEEIGNYLILDLGDEYSLICGQLKEVQAVPGEYLEKGQVIGYVAEPTKYYTLEGPNVFMELRNGQQAVDPLDYLE